MKTVLPVLAALAVFAGAGYFIWWAFVAQPTGVYLSANRQIAEYESLHKLPQGDQHGVALGEARVMAIRKGTKSFDAVVRVTRFDRQMDFRAMPGPRLEHFLDFLLFCETGQKLADNEVFEVNNNTIMYRKYSGPLKTEDLCA